MTPEHHSPGPGTPDPIALELYRHRFAAVAEEMGEALRRTGFSPNIKERLDFSCAIFNPGGQLLAQAAHIPVHLGAMPDSVRAACAMVEESGLPWQPGDVVVLNDPFQGGTHLPDITMVSPVFHEGLLCFFVANRAHHADVGGMAPGSLPLSSELYQEGLVIPPLRLVEGGRENTAVLRIILANVRTPVEREGDLRAQLAAQHLGERRLQELLASHGTAQVLTYGEHLQQYARRMVRAQRAAWPRGTYVASDSLEVRGEEAVIRVKVDIDADGVCFDFAGTSPQLRHSSLNAVASITRAACYYVLLCLLEDVPANAGTFADVRVVLPAGSIVAAQKPAAVAGGNVETSQRIVDVLLQALARAMPERIPACSQGTMNNLTIGGMRPDGSPFAYYETIGGGVGASPQGAGLDAAQSHMTNTLNTPVEALEAAYPMRVLKYSLRDGSGGAGQFSGGAGIEREYQFLTPVTATLLSERREQGPPGANGGEPGQSGECEALSGEENATVLPGKWTRHFEPGDRLKISTPGGGGWGAQLTQ